jgi:predicted RNase H-like nuclease (RuvC/YqgF family)
MTTPVEAAAAAVSLDTGGDPVLETIKWLSLAIAGLIAVSAPLLMLLRKVSSAGAANSRDAAESALYANLSEQLSSQKAQLAEIYKAHNALVLEHGRTLARVSKVEEYEVTIDELKAALAAKDDSLAVKDDELRAERSHNRELTREISSLKDRLAKLELTLAEGDAKAMRSLLDSYGSVHPHGDRTNV